MSIYYNKNIDYKKRLNSFYKYLSGTNFKNITQEKLQELFEQSKEYEKNISNKNYFFIKTNKLIDIINIIEARAKKSDLGVKAESAIIFILLIDPTFETFKIYGESNTIKEIKDKMINYFGFFDKNLIKLEKMYIKKFLSKEKRDELDQEIEERIFK